MVTRGPLVLVVGGQKSGKSGLAARIAHAAGRPVVVLAPARAGDAEMAERIAIHRADRPAAWATIEDLDLRAAVAAADPNATIIVDALDTWLLEVMADAGLWTDDDVAPWGRDGLDAADAIVAAADDLASDAGDRPGTTVLIAGQPGLGAHAMGASGRRWVDLHGRVLQAVSARADRAVLVVAGRVLDLAPPDGLVADLGDLVADLGARTTDRDRGPEGGTDGGAGPAPTGDAWPTP